MAVRVLALKSALLPNGKSFVGRCTWCRAGFRSLLGLRTLRAQTKHTSNRLPLRPGLSQPRRTLYTPRLLHERRIQLRRCPARRSHDIASKARRRGRSSRRAPEVIRSIREKGGRRLREERALTTVPLRHDDLVEELDARIFSTDRFALVDELVEHLRLAQHVHIFAVAMGTALEELVHVEVVDETGFAAFA